MSKPHNDDSNAGMEWGTPPYIVESLADTIDGFDLDPASGAEPKPYADERYTIGDDGLSQEWFGHIWSNPPYGREHNTDWAKKSYRESLRSEVDSITCLVPASTSTNWWQDYYSEGDVFCFVDHRIRFIGAGSDGASFANVIVVFGADNLPESYFSKLDDLGTVLGRTKIDNRSLLEF